MNTPVTKVPGIGPHMAGCLAEHNISTVEELATASLAVLVKVKGLGPVRATRISRAAQATIAPQATPKKNGKAVVSEPVAPATDVNASLRGQEMKKAKKDKKSKKEEKEEKAKKVKKSQKPSKNKAKKAVKKTKKVTKKKDTKKSKKVAKNKKKDVKKPKKTAKSKKKDQKKKSKKKSK